MSADTPIIISVIGGSTASSQTVSVAEEVGRELAKRGAVAACGGLGGVMEAVCRGAKSAGGTTIGVLPGNDPKEANQWVDIPICTGMGYARNAIVVQTGRAVIALDGAAGTLSEMGHTLGYGIPLIGLQASPTIKGELESKIIKADNPVDAVEKAIEAAKAR